jgi:hypothetical protein
MAEQRLGEPVPSDVLGGFGAEPESDEQSGNNAPRNRRAIWISVAAIVAVGAIAVPVALHFRHGSPAGLKTPQHVAGLTLDTSSNAKSTAEYLRSAFAAGVDLQTSIGAVYTDGGAAAQADAHSVIFVGGTARGSDATLLAQMLAQLDDSTDGITGIVTETPGPLGGEMKCGLTTDTSSQDASSDDEMAVCAFADSGDVGIALFPNRTVDQAATLMRAIRPGVQP